MNGIEATLLRLAGVPQTTIDEVEKALPHTAALLTLVRNNQDLLQRVAALLTEAQPLLVQVVPLINKALPEVLAIAPAAQDVVTFLQKQQSVAETPLPSWPPTA